MSLYLVSRNMSLINELLPSEINSSLNIVDIY